MVSRFGAAWRVCFLLALIAGMDASSSAGFTIRDLGTLVTQGTSEAEAINGTGQAAGLAVGLGGAEVAVKTSGGGGFQAVTVPPGASSSLASSINLGGDVAGTFVDSNGIRHGFYTGSGQAATISPLTVGNQQGTWTQANGINNASQVVGTGNIPGGATRAFVANAGGSPTIINPLGTGTFSQGNGINDNGTVVGTSETSPGGLQHAFLATQNGPVSDLLSRNPAGAFTFNTFGMAIANSGDVAGYGDVGQFEHAFFASSKGGSLVDLGVLAGGTSSFAYGLNNHSQVVGEVDYGTGLPGQPNSSAFVWDATQGMFNLNTLISASDQANWVLTKATGINDSDQISGEGYLDGVLHGFVLTPIPGQPIFLPPAAVPAPPTLVLSMMGMGIGAIWSRFRRGRTAGRAAA